MSLPCTIPIFASLPWCLKSGKTCFSGWKRKFPMPLAFMPKPDRVSASLSLDDARSLGSVGTVSSWFSDQHLLLEASQTLFRKRIRGVSPKSLCKAKWMPLFAQEISFPTILREQRIYFPPRTNRPAFALMSSDYYVSFSKSTDASFVQGQINKSRWMQ